MTRTVLTIGIAAVVVSVAFAGTTWASSTSSDTVAVERSVGRPSEGEQVVHFGQRQGHRNLWHCTQISGGVSASKAPDVFKKCLDGTVSKVTKATTACGSVSGSCATALNTYIGSLFSWANLVNGVQHAVSLGQLPNRANAQTAYGQITSAAKAFAKACRPSR